MLQFKTSYLKKIIFPSLIRNANTTHKLKELGTRGIHNTYRVSGEIIRTPSIFQHFFH